MWKGEIVSQISEDFLVLSKAAMNVKKADITGKIRNHSLPITQQE